MTDYYGPSEPVSPALPEHFDDQGLRSSDHASAWLRAIEGLDIPVNEQLVAVVADHVAIPEGVDPAEFLSCPDCFNDWRYPFDAEAATDDLSVRVLEPLVRIGDLSRTFDQLTRMTSALSAFEMTVDPVFELNRILSGEDHWIALQRTAQDVRECRALRPRGEAPHRLELPDGRHVPFPSTRWQLREDIAPFEWITSHERINGQVIEQLDATSQGEIIVDHTQMLWDLSADLRHGCQHTPTPMSGAVLVLCLLVHRRRRPPVGGGPERGRRGERRANE